MTTKAYRGAQRTGRDERKIRTLVNMLEEQGLAHTMKMLSDAMSRLPTMRIESRKVAELASTFQDRPFNPQSTSMLNGTNR
jgi:hypothetical protein